MKVKIKKGNQEIKVDYFKTKNIHDFRYDVLSTLLTLAKEEAILFIDTNSGNKKFTISQIQSILDQYSLSYLVEETKKAKKSLFGTGLSIKRRKEAKAVKESIMAIKMNKDGIKRELYDEFLQYFDYAIGIDPLEEIDKLMATYRLNYFDVLFNKKVLPLCVYDSILIGSLRIDTDDKKVENMIKEVVKRKDA